MIFYFICLNFIIKSFEELIKKEIPTLHIQESFSYLYNFSPQKKKKEIETINTLL